MPRYGSYKQREASEMFYDREEIIEKFRVSTMDEICQNFGYYDGILKFLKSMLDDCEKFIYDEEELEETLKYFPDFENLAFDLYEYVYEDETWIYKRDIDDLIAILSVKMAEYDQYVLNYKVDIGIALALIMSREIRDKADM